MTELQESTLIGEALAIIDHGLGEMSRRTIMSTNEAADLLLDLRMILARAELCVAGLDGPTSVAHDHTPSEVIVTTSPGSEAGTASRSHGLAGFWHPSLGHHGRPGSAV